MQVSKLNHSFRLSLALLATLAAGTAAHANGTLIKSELKLRNNNPVPLADGDEFGHGIARIGDLDGNGTADMVVGAPGDDTTGPNNGAIHVLFMNPDHTVSTISTYHGGSVGQSSLYFGKSVCGIGDVDGDGIEDIAVGMVDGVDILLMLPSGQPRLVTLIEDGMSGFNGTAGDYFGDSLASLGDFDNDGRRDLLVGAPRDDDGAANAGAVYILSLRPRGRVYAQYKISMNSGSFPGLLQGGDVFGGAVAHLGDLDGDGVDDIAVGAEGDDDGGSFAGALWVLRLQADFTVKAATKISALNGGFAAPLDIGDALGCSLNGVGDVDQDGTPDLMVGAYGDDDGGLNRGAVYTLFLHPDGTIASSSKYSTTRGGISGNFTDGALFGGSIATLGDLDGDGADEFAIGCHEDSAGGPQRGSVFLFGRQPIVHGAIQALGCNLNAPNSLLITGAPVIGGKNFYAIDNPFGSQSDGSIPFLAIGSNVYATPCGAPMRGWNMDPSQKNGELMLLPPFAQFVAGPLWFQGSPSVVQVIIPSDLNLVGVEVGAQAVLIDRDPSATIPFGLTQARRVRIGSCP